MLRFGKEFYRMRRLNKIDKKSKNNTYTCEKSKLVVNLAGIGISLVDFTPREIAFVSVSNIKACI
jgi:hypothetical protein